MCGDLGREPYFYLTGGDSLLHPRFWTLARLLHERGHMWAVMGNPFHLDADVCILELVGPKTLKESLALAAAPSQVCMTGILAKPYEIEGFDPIKDIPNGVSLSGFYSNYPDQEAIDAIFSFIAAHDLRPLVAKRYRLEQVGQANSDMEHARLMGKAVVVVDDRE